MELALALFVNCLKNITKSCLLGRHLAGRAEQMGKKLGQSFESWLILTRIQERRSEQMPERKGKLTQSLHTKGGIKRNTGDSGTRAAGSGG